MRDMKKTQPEKQSLTPMQKQAVLVCAVCALAAVLTIGITLTLLKRGKTPSAPVEQPSSEVLVPGEEDISDHYQINETSSALLPETADAGEDYQKETLFIGDSNTVRLYANGLVSLQQFCAKEGIGTHAALNEGIVTFKKDSSTYTIAQAVAKMKPRRVVIMLGTNDTGMSVDEFIKNYTALVQAIQESYPYTDIIVNTVPPVPANHSNYPNMDQTKIDDFNMALLSMCEQMGLKFLNTAEVLKDANGYGREDYYQSGDIHLKPAGLKALLSSCAPMLTRPMTAARIPPTFPNARNTRQIPVLRWQHPAARRLQALPKGRVCCIRPPIVWIRTAAVPCPAAATAARRH